MKFCPECGTQNASETVKFCSNCGFSFATPGTAPPPAAVPPPVPSPPAEAQPVAPPTSSDTAKKLASGFGKLAWAAGKYTAEKILPKLLELSKKQLEDVIENASKEEDSGVMDGTTGRQFEEIVSTIFTQRKYRVVQRNMHVEEREVDIIAARGDNAAMIECKARSKPVGALEMDSYIVLFRQIRQKSYGGAKLQRLIIVAPKGGVSSDAKNKATRELGDAVEFWEKDRFEREYEKVKQE